MNTFKKKLLLTLFFIIGISTMSAQSYNVVGSVSGKQEAGEMFELYKNSADSFRDFLAGWQDMGPRDRTREYSYDQIYNICLEQAKREYGRYYSNIDVTSVRYIVNYEPLDDVEYYTSEVGSGTQYRKKERSQKVYMYSATVIVRE